MAGAAGGSGWLVGPVIVTLVMLGLALFLRSAIGTGYGRDRRARAGQHPEDGLLTLVATVSARDTALALRAVLSDAGIRSTLRSPAPHRTDVLVFPEDADRARALAASFGGPD